MSYATRMPTIPILLGVSKLHARFISVCFDDTWIKFLTKGTVCLCCFKPVEYNIIP